MDAREFDQFSGLGLRCIQGFFLWAGLFRVKNMFRACLGVRAVEGLGSMAGFDRNFQGFRLCWGLWVYGTAFEV